MSQKSKIIAFQGAHGAYSDLSCRTVYPQIKTMPCNSFQDAFDAVRNHDADLAMIPVDNTIAGRVADVHHLIPGSELFVIGEHFQPVEHALLGVKGANIDDIKEVHSHVHAIPQCKKIIKDMGLTAHIHADTAGAAKDVAARGDKTHAAIASTLAADLYDLQILKDNVQDQDNNVTRFLIFSREPEIPNLGEIMAKKRSVITSLIFETRNISAALYKALGGFATNGLSLSKLESYLSPDFTSALFYCDIDGHPDTPEFKQALEELGFYAKDVTFLGTYPAHPFRKKPNKEYT